MTEYIVVAAVIAAGGIVTVWLFGNVILGIFSQIGTALKQEEADLDKTGVEEALAAIEQDSSSPRNMSTFDSTKVGGGGGGDSSGSGTGHEIVDLRGNFHLGDSPTADGAFVNCGLRLEFGMDISPHTLESGNGTLYLSFQAGNRMGDINNVINNPDVNAVLLDGQVVGYIQNGNNCIALPGLQPGLHTLVFTSGELASTHDDFNITGARISY